MPAYFLNFVIFTVLFLLMNQLGVTFGFPSAATPRALAIIAIMSVVMEHIGKRKKD